MISGSFMKNRMSAFITFMFLNFPARGTFKLAKGFCLISLNYAQLDKQTNDKSEHR